MKNANMLYRSPGPEKFEGVSCETTIVEAEEVEAKLADGWSLNWIEAGKVADDLAAKLAANEAEQAENEKKLAAGKKAK